MRCSPTVFGDAGSQIGMLTQKAWSIRPYLLGRHSTIFWLTRLAGGDPAGRLLWLTRKARWRAASRGRPPE